MTADMLMACMMSLSLFLTLGIKNENDYLKCLSSAAPPSYSDLRISESHRRDCLRGCNRSEQEEEDYSALLTYITEFRYLPPPVYSEVHTATTHI